MPRPAACGFPDASNAGVTRGAKLTAATGVVTLAEAGQVYENKQLTGSIIVTGANVTIRNVRLIATDPYYGIRVQNAHDWNNDRANLVLDHVEIDLNGNVGMTGIAFNGYTMRHSFIHNGADCAHFATNVTIEDTLCATGPDGDNDGWPDNRKFCNAPASTSMVSSRMAGPPRRSVITPYATHAVRRVTSRFSARSMTSRSPTISWPAVVTRCTAAVHGDKRDRVRQPLRPDVVSPLGLLGTDRVLRQRGTVTGSHWDGNSPARPPAGRLTTRREAPDARRSTPVKNNRGGNP